MNLTKLIRVYELSTQKSYAPQALLTTSFNFFRDCRTIDNMLKAIINALLVNACNQTIMWHAQKKYNCYFQYHVAFCTSQ